MTFEFEVPMIGMLFMLMLTIVYYSKEKKVLVENRYFEIILICSFAYCILDTLLHFFASIYSFETLNTTLFGFISFANKVMSILSVTLFFSLLCYTLAISYKKCHDNEKILRNLLRGVVIIYTVAALFTSIRIEQVGTITTTVGSTADLSYIAVGIILVFNFVITIANFKHLDERYMVMLFILISIVFFAILTINFPGIIVTDLLVTSICYVMYFTIENPDVKMIEQVSLARDKAEKANKAKTDFLSNMSHEIRTPLNAIVGFSECILTDETLESAQKDAQDIVVSAQNLLEIVNGILDISKIEADKVEFVNIEYNLKDELSELIKIVQPRIGEKPIQLKYHFAEDLPYNLYGDIGKIRQIVSNILTNAIKYTEKGYIAIEVSCINHNNESTIIISVEDTGRGIKPDKIDKIFDKFERLEEDRNTTLEGTGLGLAITKRLAEMMGGKVIVQSKYGEGSKFTVYLKQEIHANTAKKLKRVIEPIKVFDISGKKILVVDDNRINLKVAVRLLEQYHVDVTECESGFDCLKKVQAGERYDLILMDDMMPKLSGTETLKELKKLEHFNTPVVVLTANAIEGMKEKYLESGFFDYISKPIDKKELERILSKTLADIDVTREISFEPLPSEIYDLDTPLQDKEEK